MNTTIGVLLLAAATVGDGFGYGRPGVGFMKLLRGHAVTNGAAPPGGMIGPGADGGGPGGGPGGGAGGRRFPNDRSQIFFLDPNGMHIGWQTGTANGERIYLPAQLTVPARYNFMQGFIYRLKLTEISGRPGVVLYPTIEVAPSTPQTDAYLTHNPIPVQFTPEDFEQVVDGGNFVTKVLYLPDPKYQELAVAGVETLVSTRLEPGVDPILEADKRGTILLIVRLGAIDLEMQNNATGAMMEPGATTSVPPPGVAPSVPAGAMPPGAVPTPPPPTETVPVDTAPVTPVPPVAPPMPAPVTPPPPPAVEPPAVPAVPAVPAGVEAPPAEAPRP
jgi:hypothetical protein